MDDKNIKKYKTQIIYKMKQVGTYHPSFAYTVDTLAKILVDCEDTEKKFKATGGNKLVMHTNKGGATNIVKNPLYQAIEKMRDDIITYSRELGLTPSGLKRINQEGMKEDKKSKLSIMLSEFERR